MNKQPVVGFLFALIAVIMWGALPIGLQQILKTLDPQTIVWYRFFVAGLGLFIILSFKKTRPKLIALHRRYIWLLLLAIFGLSVNFLLFNVALQYIPPTTSQVLSPLSSFIMLFAGVFVFKEKIGTHQKIGLGILLLGLLMFFNQRLGDFIHFSAYAKGICIAFIASSAWVLYGIAQKILLLKFTAQQVLLLIYIGCAILFFPFATPFKAIELTGFQIACLIFCCANTLIAYGCYAEALNRWDVSKVSAIMTQIPVFTILFSEILTKITPHLFSPTDLNRLSYLGAIVVVSGALFSAIGHKILIK